MIVGGYSTFNTPSHAFVWTQPTGMVDLGTLPGETSSRAFAVNRDGSVIVGQSGDSAFRQTRPGTMTRLNPITPGASSQAFAVNASGSVISGTSAAHAVIWTNTRGLIDLNTYLPAHGINLTDWTLLVAYGISADGRTIVGSGSHNGLAEGWVVTLPVCLGDFNLDGDISADDIFAFLSAWFARDPRADIDISGIVNEQDIFAYISAWFGGC